MTIKVMIPVRELIEPLKVSTLATIAEYELKVPRKTVWRDIVAIQVMDILRARSNYVKDKEPKLPAFLESNFEWYRKEDEFSDWWFSTILEPFFFRLATFLEIQCGDQGWLEWKVEDIGSDIMLISKGDFRINQWSRMVEGTDWKI